MPDTSAITFNFDMIPADLKTKILWFFTDILVLIINAAGSLVTLILEFISNPFVYGSLISLGVIISIKLWGKRKSKWIIV